MLKKVSVEKDLDVEVVEVVPEAISSFSIAINELLEAHHKTQKTILLWGNSGYGKSSSVISYAKNKGFKLIKIQCIALDPLTVSFPIEKEGVMKFVPCEWMNEVCNATEPTVLLFDEANKFSNPSVENMLNSLFLDREYNGHKISDSVLIVGTLNFKALSNTAQELDFSIINRATNVLFAPNKTSIISNLQSKTAQALAMFLPISCSGEEEFQEEVLDRLHVSDDETSPRQIDDLSFICDNSSLGHKALELLCVGRLGDKKGAIAFNYFKNRNAYEPLTKNNFNQLINKWKNGERELVKGSLKLCKDESLIQTFASAVGDRTLDAFVKTQL